MKNIIKQITTLSLAVIAGLMVASCSFDEVIDPNGPSIDGVLVNASKGQLNELVVGIESTLRNGRSTEATASGTMARELYLFDADPRNTGDLLGKNGIGLDNNSFYSVSQWNGNYRSIKNANVLIEAVQNTDAVTDTERNGYLGFAKTIIAYEMIQLVKSYGQARVEVADLENLGPIENGDVVLQFAAGLLSEANGHLDSAGSEFVFSLSSGFTDFATPSSFNQFSQGVAGLAQVYLGNGSPAIALLNQSHLNLNGDLTNGPKHIFGLGSGDQANDLFKVDGDNGNQIIVHDSFLNDADANDSRVATKTNVRVDPQSQDDLNGTNETDLYASNTSSIDMLRNEELILVWAEANILAGSTGPAEDALNVIRDSAGVGAYGGASDAASLTTELLKQRRYSLWCENHRMYDLRRYALSSTLPIDRVGDQVFNVFPIPLSENN